MDKLIKKLLLTLLLLSGVMTVSAQSNGDKLFLEGQRYQRTMTVASQNTAIARFSAAKVVYTTTDKKAMCDNQIAICRSNIKTISSGGVKKEAVVKSSKKEKKKKKEEQTEPTTAQEPVKKARTDVSLKLSETRLDFKYKPKKGATQSVEVQCNYDDWTIESKPDWLEVYTAKDKFSVEVSENTTDDDRSGIITIKCEDKEASVVVNQDKKKGIDKIVGSVFKKKKN